MRGEDRLPLSILLAHGEKTDEPCLPVGVPAAALATAPRLELRQENEALDFGNDAADPSSLPERRWGLVLPREESLRRALIAALQPLIEHRAAQVGYASAAELLARDVFLVESDPELSEQDAEQWYQLCYKQEGEHELLRRDPLERPDYLLLLGDLHQVPESIHRVLGQSGRSLRRGGRALAARARRDRRLLGCDRERGQGLHEQHDARGALGLGCVHHELGPLFFCRGLPTKEQGLCLARFAAARGPTGAHTLEAAAGKGGAHHDLSSWRRGPKAAESARGGCGIRRPAHARRSRTYTRPPVPLSHKPADSARAKPRVGLASGWHPLCNRKPRDKSQGPAGRTRSGSDRP